MPVKSSIWSKRSVVKARLVGGKGTTILQRDNTYNINADVNQEDIDNIQSQVTDNALKNNQQDSRLDANDTKNSEQDKKINDNAEDIATNEADIAALDSRLTSLEAEVAEIKPWVATNFVGAGYGAMRLSTSVAGADLGAGWDVLDYVDEIHVTPRAMLLDISTGEFTFQIEGVWIVCLNFAFDHNEVNAGRVVYVRIYDVTQGSPGPGLEIGTARNISVTNAYPTLMVEVNSNDVYRLEIGGGDIYTNVVWNTLAISANLVSEPRGILLT